MLCLFLGTAAASAQVTVSLEQASNGTPEAPISPSDWITQNVNAQRGHFVEGASAPYRIVLDPVLPGAHRVVIAWDTKHSGRHAIDYLTHFNRMQPHNQFGAHNVPETIQPLRGLSGGLEGPFTFPIPAPSGLGSPVAGLPQNSFGALPASERMFHIYNGTITNAVYLEQASLTNTAAESRMAIDFVANDMPVVILFGGHLAAKSEWGVGRTAGNVPSAEYRMRLVEFNGIPQLQSLTLHAGAVVSPPSCQIFGQQALCPGIVNSYAASTDATGATFTWSFTQNTSGASFAGASVGNVVQVRSGTSGGSFTLQVVVTQGALNSVCTYPVTVLTNTSATPLANASACVGGSAMFSTQPSGAGPFSFRWRKGTTYLSGETNNTLVLTNVTQASVGTYCVEVAGTCNYATNCASLTVVSNTTATPLANLERCAGESASFSTTPGGAGPFSYVWRKNGVEIPGQTNRMYSIASVTSADAGTYTVEVSGRCNSITNSGTLSVHPLPVCGIDGPGTVCPNASGIVFAAPPNMAAYRWRVTGNGAIVGPTNQQTVIVASTSAGLFTLNLTVVNSNGCSRACSRTITVGDIQPPAIVCPGNIQTNTEPGKCSRVVEFAVTGADNCRVASLVCNPPSGAAFAKGVTTVNCTAADESGNQATCSFNVTVVDLEKPALTCPTNLVANTQPGLCEAAVTYNAAVTDNCPGASLVCSPPSGTTFPLGVSSVTCRGSDAAGNIEFCTFDVTVADNEAPQITCPPDLTFTTDPGQCDLVVNYDAQATDNCGMAQLSCVPPSGSLFSAGDTEVICVASDANQNQSRCSFQVHVDDGENPQIVCPADISVTTEPDRCDAVVNFTLQASDNCREVGVACVPPSGSRFPLGQTNVTCIATDSGGNAASCAFKVTVSDDQRPVLTCPPNLTTNTSPGRCDAVVQYAPGITDNCPGATVQCLPPPGSVFAAGLTVVNCFAEDASSNAVSCAFNVVVQDAESPTISCPDAVATNAPPGQCSALVSYQISAADNCGAAEVFCSPESGSVFELGETPVFCVAMDASGNSQECSFSVTVNDVEKPVISCPADLTINTANGRCDAVATFAATASDNCLALSMLCAPPSGSTFPKGTNTVNCTAGDASGNTSACAFRVIVQDREPPALACPVNMVVSNETGRCDAAVSFAATATDNCGGATVVCSPASDARFPVGLSTVNCVATDTSGNTNRCSFTVTVRDTQKPAITCPGNLLRATEPGRCDARVTFSAMASDNCAVTSITCAPPSGVSFSRGTTPVICTARDSSGNEESCSFSITVMDTEPPAITCPTNLVVAAEAGRCDALVSFAPSVSDNCPDASVVCSPPAGTRFVIGQTPVTCVATDAWGNTNRCSFTVTVRDLEQPRVVCPEDIVAATEPGRCDAQVSFSATVSDNCPGATVQCVPPSASRFPRGATTVSCTATDVSGNSAACAFTVTVNDNQPPLLTCPTNIVTNTATGRCDAVVSYAAAVTDNCAGATVVCTPASGATFPLGNTPVSCLATDASGNTNRCSFTVTVQDNQRPAITCPGNLLRATEAGRCDALVTFSATASDNCAVASLACVPPPGSRFSKGTTPVTCTARDSSGNEESCSFTITVIDTEPPAITCPTNQVVVAEAGRCDALVSFAPSFSDNCPAASVVCSPPAGTRFVVGQTPVSCVATDASGNTNRCSFLVTVRDLEQPQVVCPEDIIVVTEPGRCDAQATFSAPISDNCPGATVQCVPLSGSRFPRGQTVVSCTATDASGNAAACAFTVTVNDNQPPLLTCPTSIATNTIAGRCDAIVSYAPAVTDNCPGATVVCAPPSGASFSVGLTPVTCVATDASGNTNRCSFTVDVLDREKPVITCPPSQELFTATGQCDAIATFAAAVTDNCPGVSVACEPLSGSRFGTGVNTVRCTASDQSGNVESCFFTVTVYDVEPPAINCPANIITAADPGRCDAVVIYAANAVDNCAAVTPVCAPPSGTRFAPGTTLVSCTATDASGNIAACSFSVKVEDREEPRLICPGDVVTNTAPGRCNAVLEFAPSVSDNCAVAEVVCEPPSGSTFPLGTNTVLCIASDDSGNSDGCAFLVVVRDAERPAIVCPANLTVSTEPGRCDAAVTFAASAADNCSQAAVVCNPPSGSRFSQGVTPVVCTAADTSGNSATCAFTVTVNDNTLPVVTCPQDLVLNAEPGMCSARATFSAQVSDNCPGATVTCMPPSNSEFPVGTTTVICQGTDTAGNAQWCAFDVRVIDAEAPRLICPDDLIVNTEPTQCTASVAYDITANDACSAANLVCAPANGSLFPKGVTVVRCSARDASGNEASCAFNVTVRDSEPPALICPTNMVVAASAGRCDAVVEFTPSHLDNCPGANLVCSPPSGSTFSLGTTFVSCTAADAAGNTNQCSFSVRVIDAQKPILTCSSNLVVDCETNRCDAIVTFATSVTDNCGATGINCVPASGSRFALGSTAVTCSSVDGAGNVGSCSFTVTVRDTQPPVLQCPANIVAAAASGRCDAPVSFNVPATDNCATVSGSCFPPSGSVFPVGTTTVICSVWDSSSNPATCQFTVTVRDVEPPVLQCPGEILANTAPGRCDAIVAFTAPQASDNCSTAGVTCDPPSGATFAKGTNFVTCTALDASSNSVNCAFRVIVRDLERPQITCPGDMVVSTASDECRSRVTYTATATDNCNDATIVCSPPSNSFFNKGVTPVICVATDASGNTNRCSFTVTVNDTVPPSIVCPSSITTNAAPGQTSAVVHFAPAVSDNCPGASYVCAPQSGSVFQQGTTPVTCTATDASGNSRACSFTVSVIDTEPPVINCPANLLVPATTGRCDAVANYTITATDNSQSAVIVCAPPSGSILAKGITGVLCTATDPSSNSVSCAFTVTVIDLEKPAVICPTNIIVHTDRGRCDARVTYTTNATDNCGAVSLACNPPSGAILPKGTNTVTCTASDSSGNADTCAFTVRVLDKENPVVSCPANLSFTLPPGQCQMTVNYNNGVTDNCPGATVSCVPPSGSLFTRSVTPVDCTGRDTSGNTATCGFLVDVRDNQAPVITCPPEINTVTFPGTCGALVSYPVTVSDNCSGAAVSCNPPSGSMMPVGTNWVTCNATDGSGNTAGCSFRVIVRDAERPTLSCPADIVIDGSNGNCASVATYSPTVSDNCPGATVNCAPPSGTTFPQGTNRVQCMALDASGNMSGCAFSVIVRLQPLLATPLTSQVRCAGQSASFATFAGGSGPIAFAWLKDGVALPGQTNTSLLLSNLVPANSGTYSVVVRNPCSSITNSATLQVNSLVTVNGLTNVTRCDCDPLVLSPVVSGAGPFSYTWRKNGAVLPGATDATLAFAKLGTNDAGVYSVEVTGPCNTALASASVNIISVPNPAVYTNSGAIRINDNATAFPYPASVRATCVPRPVQRATATLRGFTHAYPDDVDVLLASPDGKCVMLMSDAGDGSLANNINITLDDSAALPLPDSTQLFSGVFRPGNYDTDADAFPPPAPKLAPAATLSAFAGTAPNGFWSLFVVDDFQIDGGMINNGWVLRLYWDSSPVSLTAPRMLPNGLFQMTIIGDTGTTHVIEASSDLITWNPIATITLSGARTDFIDPNPAAARFYRCTQP